MSSGHFQMSIQELAGMRRLIDNFFADPRVKPQVAMMMENIEAIKSLIGAGTGASVLPVHSVGNEAADRKVRLMRVVGHPLYRRLALVTLKSSYIPKAVNELSRLITEAIGTNLYSTDVM